VLEHDAAEQRDVLDPDAVGRARAGAEVVELFSSQRVASVTPSARRLRRFAKITLQPDETREVTFQVGPDDFAIVNADGQRVVEPGVYTIQVAKLKKDLIVR
jgi:beta-glucosidase